MLENLKFSPTEPIPREEMLFSDVSNWFLALFYTADNPMSTVFHFLAVLGQVIAENPVFRGKWSAPVPPITDETRQDVAEQLNTSQQLRRAVRELGFDPDGLAGIGGRRAFTPETRTNSNTPAAGNC